MDGLDGIGIHLMMSNAIYSDWKLLCTLQKKGITFSIMYNVQNVQCNVQNSKLFYRSY